MKRPPPAIEATETASTRAPADPRDHPSRARTSQSIRSMAPNPLRGGAPSASHAAAPEPAPRRRSVEYSTSASLEDHHHHHHPNSSSHRTTTALKYGRFATLGGGGDLSSTSGVSNTTLTSAMDDDTTTHSGSGAFVPLLHDAALDEHLMRVHIDAAATGIPRSNPSRPHQQQHQ